MTREEAINEIKSWDFLNGKEIEAVQTLIPELRESEDERARKWILEYLYDGLRKADEQFKDHFKSAIYWIKEQKPADEQFPPLEGLDAIKAKYYDDGFKNGFDEGVESVKPTEWSEFDKDCLKRAIWYIENPAPSVVKDTNLALWLKSIPERLAFQPKQEWSEEDERMRQAILQDLANIKVAFPKVNIQGEFDWLKSLRLRPSWKPSEEQMAALEKWLKDKRFDGDSRYVYPIFESLYKQLKSIQ